MDESVLRERLVQARFEALAEWGVAFDEAGTIARRVDLDIVAVIRLLQRGCPPRLVVSILS